jgi:hypothetical protein
MIAMPHWHDVLDTLHEKRGVPNLFHRVLLWGPPGTGKSTWGEHTMGKVQRVAMHRDMAYEDLVGCKDLRSDGKGGMDSVWTDGPAVSAMRDGEPLILDEIDAFSPETRCLLHALLDDKEIARLTLPSGEVVRPSDGFCVFATTNKNPACLPEPIQDRFEFVLYCHDPHPGILKKLGPAFRRVLKSHYKALSRDSYQPAFSARTIGTLNRIMDSRMWDAETCVNMMFPKESTTLLTSLGLAGVTI